MIPGFDGAFLSLDSKDAWANGQVERMSRKIEKAAVKRVHYETPPIGFGLIAPTS